MAGKCDALLARSFELVYHDPSSLTEGRMHFHDESRPCLTMEQRFEYLKAYSDALRDFYDLGDDFLSTEVVSHSDLSKARKGIKEKPAPQVRRVVPLRYWRWTLEGDSGAEPTWTSPSYNDDTWSELETPRLVCKSRSFLLRTGFLLEDFERVWLDIESIIDEYDVWVNGEHLCHHDGFEPVRFELSDMLLSNEWNCLAIRVEGREEEQIGIAGRVNLLCTAGACLDDLFVRTREVRGTEAVVEIRATVNNTGPDVFRGDLDIALNRWFPDETDKVALSASLGVELCGRLSRLA